MVKTKKYIFLLVSLDSKITKPYLIYTLRKPFEKDVDLLLRSNSENFHYILIKEFHRFMTNKTKNHGKKHFCPDCGQYSSSLKTSHVKDYLAINYTKSKVSFTA